MRLLIMGPPGAGKGTQAARLAARLGVPAISTGDIFRANVTAGTPLGVEARRYMDAGEYVPDSVTNAMVRDRLAEADCASGFLLDGYPRTVAQVGELDGILAAQDQALHGVLLLEVDDAELVRRLLARAVTEGRADDTEDVVRRRQEVYREQTAPLIEVYAARGLVHSVDGLGDVDDVQARLWESVSVPDRRPARVPSARSEASLARPERSVGGAR
jgi:adenylate kinase